MKKYNTIEEIVRQLEWCEFNDKMGHPLEKNTAFIALKLLKHPKKLSNDLSAVVSGSLLNKGQVDNIITPEEFEDARSKIRIGGNDC